MANMAAALSPTDLLGVSIADDNPVSLVKALEAGLPAGALARFKRRSKLADTDLAGLLRVGARTLTRVKGSKARRLPPELSERLYALAAIYAEAEGVFGDRATALGWLAAPQFALGGAAPRDLLASEVGRQQVSTLLRRIEHGLLA
jgi:putative toxin-antitoxin system antitoxin component (TIGR02293 family)